MENSANQSSRLSLREFIKGLSTDPDLFVSLVEKHKDILTLKSLFVNGYLFTSPHHVKHVLGTQPSYSRSQFTRKFLKNYLGNYSLPSILDEAIWEKDRTAITNLFGKNKLMDYAGIITKIVNERVDSWNNFAKNETPIKIEQLAIEIALNIVLSTVLGGVQEDVTSIPYLTRHLKTLSTPKVFPLVKLGKIPMPLYFRYKKLLNQLREIAECIVKQAFTVSKENIVVQLANVYGFQSYEQLDGKMKEHLTDQVISMLIGGHENTVITLVNIIVITSIYPSIADHIREEAKSVLGTRDPTYDDLTKLPYLRAVVKETLRLYPPSIASDRAPLQDDRFEGHLIKTSDLVIIPIYALQRHPTYWENPQAFDPSRFLKPLTNEQQMCFIPFGLGSHACLGGQFAMAEIMLIITMLLQRFYFALLPGQSLNRNMRNINYRLDPNLTMKIYR